MAHNIRCLSLALLCLGVSGCTFLDDDSDIEVLFYNHQTPPELSDPARLHLQLDGPGADFSLSGSDFTTQRYGTLHSRRLSLPGEGELRVLVAIVQPPADTLGQLTFSFGLQRRYHYGIGVQPGGQRPQGICVGTIETTLLRRPGTSVATDTLWVTHGGIPEGSIC